MSNLNELFEKFAAADKSVSEEDLVYAIKNCEQLDVLKEINKEVKSKKTGWGQKAAGHLRVVTALKNTIASLERASA